MNRAHEYINDFLYFVLRSDEKRGPNTLLYCSGVNVSRFSPITKGRHGIGSNYFWYLRDPAGNFAEYTSDLDVIDDAEAWRVASSLPAHGLAAWGPPVPHEFLAPPDVRALATESQP